MTRGAQGPVRPKVAVREREPIAVPVVVGYDLAVSTLGFLRFRRARMSLFSDLSFETSFLGLSFIPSCSKNAPESFRADFAYRRLIHA